MLARIIQHEMHCNISAEMQRKRTLHGVLVRKSSFSLPFVGALGHVMYYHQTLSKIFALIVQIYSRNCYLSCQIMSYLNLHYFSIG